MKTTKHPELSLASGVCAAALGGAALLITLQPAAANGIAEREVRIEATVEPLCTMTNFDKSTLKIDVVDGRPVVAPVYTTTTVTCNTEIGLRLMSEWGGMQDSRHRDGSATEVNTFISSFDYVAEVQRNGNTLLEYDTSTNPGFGSLEMADDFHVIAPGDVVQNIELTVQVMPKPLPAGEILQASVYEDRLTLQILPTF